MGKPDRVKPLSSRVALLTSTNPFPLVSHRYGSVLIASCENMAGDIVTVFLVVLIGTFSLGQALPELETFASAMGAAAFIYKTIDRVSFSTCLSHDHHMTTQLPLSVT